MSAAREELAADWEAAYSADVPVVNYLFALGYRKPRTITTAEELDGLEVGSVVLDRLDICYRLYNDPAYREPVWCVVGEASPSSPHGWLPATVLYEPTA